MSIVVSMPPYQNVTQYVFESIETQADYYRGNRWKFDEEEKEEISAPYYPDEWEFNFICKMAYAENNTESDYSTRFVIDCLINRVRDKQFPDSYYGCITQRGQYQTWSNGAISRAPVTERMKRLVDEELRKQTDISDLKYFTAGYYNPFCTPAFNIGNVYFGR